MLIGHLPGPRSHHPTSWGCPDVNGRSAVRAMTYAAAPLPRPCAINHKSAAQTSAILSSHPKRNETKAISPFSKGSRVCMETKLASAKTPSFTSYTKGSEIDLPRRGHGQAAPSQPGCSSCMRAPAPHTQAVPTTPPQRHHSGQQPGHPPQNVIAEQAGVPCLEQPR